MRISRDDVHNYIYSSNSPVPEKRTFLRKLFNAYMQAMIFTSKVTYAYEWRSLEPFGQSQQDFRSYDDRALQATDLSTLTDHIAVSRGARNLGFYQYLAESFFPVVQVTIADGNSAPLGPTRTDADAAGNIYGTDSYLPIQWPRPVVYYLSDWDNFASVTVPTGTRTLLSPGLQVVAPNGSTAPIARAPFTIANPASIVGLVAYYGLQDLLASPTAAGDYSGNNLALTVSNLARTTLPDGSYALTGNGTSGYASCSLAGITTRLVASMKVLQGSWSTTPEVLVSSRNPSSPVAGTIFVERNRSGQAGRIAVGYQTSGSALVVGYYDLPGDSEYDLMATWNTTDTSTNVVQLSVNGVGVPLQYEASAGTARPNLSVSTLRWFANVGGSQWSTASMKNLRLDSGTVLASIPTFKTLISIKKSSATLWTGDAYLQIGTAPGGAKIPFSRLDPNWQESFDAAPLGAFATLQCSLLGGGSTFSADLQLGTGADFTLNTIQFWDGVSTQADYPFQPSASDATGAPVLQFFMDFCFESGPTYDSLLDPFLPVDEFSVQLTQFLLELSIVKHARLFPFVYPRFNCTYLQVKQDTTNFSVMVDALASALYTTDQLGLAASTDQGFSTDNITISRSTISQFNKVRINNGSYVDSISGQTIVIPDADVSPVQLLSDPLMFYWDIPGLPADEGRPAWTRFAIYSPLGTGTVLVDFTILSPFYQQAVNNENGNVIRYYLKLSS